ncbi:MAG: Fic family protein, partial [Gammaproteobacteria bacterium]|nr:Fic family protein [Gammaproteobacteria bacterium]
AASSLPNQGILIDTLLLQEALASSEIENIVTTQDKVFQVGLSVGNVTIEAKEVDRYRVAMQRGYEKWQENGFISENMLIEMYRVLKQRNDGYRMGAGTVLRNEQTGEIVYEPPQSQNDIIAYMRQLEQVINDSDSCNNLDPLIKMALIHHKFESIHPFPDGNGRVGRMLNVLYLIHCGLLDSPILYLSRAINRTKPDYYRLLQAVRDEGVWEKWVEYMLNAVAETAYSTVQLIISVKDLMMQMKHRMRKELPKLYSHDLLNNLFRYPYTRIEFLERDLPYTRQTARKYLEMLSDSGFVNKVSAGRNNYYINHALVELFMNVPIVPTSNSEEASTD